MIRFRRHGFTLIEMLLVLLLISLITSLVVPNLQLIISNFTEKDKKILIIEKLSKLNKLAYQNAKQFELYKLPSEEDWIDSEVGLPNKWTIRFKDKVTYYPTGSCSGGIVELSNQTESWRFFLQPPYCTKLISINSK